MIYIDTGAFIARYMQNDQSHQAAVKIWESISNQNKRCFTSNFVLDETLTLLARRAGYGFASERAHNIYSSEQLTILRPHEEDELEALELFQKYADQKVSFTDCISFVLMRKSRLHTVFSFDKHFSQNGFETLQ
jgi:uncharacterized protein